jgi:hypothetical protein
MSEPNNTYNDNKDYENDLNSFVDESDIIEEDVYDADGDADGDDDFYGADGNASPIGGEIDEEEEELDSNDDFIYDIDFSQFKGKDFKSSLRNVNKTVSSKKKLQVKAHKKKKKMVKKPLSQEIVVKKRATLYGKKTQSGGEAKTTKRIIVPSTQKVIVEGVDKFILGEDKCGVKDIGYYKCKKLKELVFTMNNNSGVDFNLELFNPSEPLDYLFATSGNLNNKIQVAGGIVSYSDVLFNILANPTHLVNAKFTFAGATVQQQINQPLIFKNKRITGDQKVEPLQLQLQVDTMQVANDIVFFDILGNLNRPFIPNGMDVIQYKVLAGNTVTFAFYYEQKDLRKFFFKEARDSKKLI